MTRRQSRRTQRALKAALFGPEPAPARRSKPRAERSPCEAPPQKIGDCAFCGNHTELGYPDDVWICNHCGGVYVYGDTSPRNATEPACRLCGKPATRFQDHGADGVLLFCDGHDAGEVEPFACEPLTAAPALYTIDGEGITTLAGFLAANDQLDEETIAAIRALDVGGEYSDGGGAWAEWTIARVR